MRYLGLLIGLFGYGVLVVNLFTGDDLWFRIGVVCVVFSLVVRLTGLEQHIETHDHVIGDIKDHVIGKHVQEKEQS